MSEAERRAEQNRQRALQYYYDNRKQVLSKQKTYREGNLEICRHRVNSANTRNAGTRPSDYANGGRDRFLKRVYGISAADYEALLEKQRGVCAICGAAGGRRLKKSGRRKRLSVDHCHTTKKVRGLLCEACNTAIGLLKENLSLLRSAVAYLRKHSFPNRLS
jgi:hypothetical protein